KSSVQRVRSIADLSLARQKHEHVTGRFSPQLFHRVTDRVEEIALGLADANLPVLRVGHGAFFSERAVAYLDGEGAAGDLDDRGRLLCSWVSEMPRKRLRIDRCRGDDHLEIGSAGQQSPQIPQQEIDIE